MLRAGVLLVVGLCLLAAAAVLSLGVHRFRREAARAPGEVVRLHGGGSHPEVAFTPANGERLSMSQGGFIGGYRVGDRVSVLYRPDAPRVTARLDAAGSLWFWPALAGLIGGFFVVVGATNLLIREGI